LPFFMGGFEKHGLINALKTLLPDGLFFWLGPF
jgi:hypothetical protein